MRKQSMRYGAAGVAALILVVALVVMANWLAARHYQRWDWTSSKLYTLSEKSIDLVRGLETEVRIVVFMVPSSPLFDQAQELLTRYAAVSDKIVLEYIDPEREPLKTKALAEQFGITMADTVVFISGDRTKYVTSEQMVEYDYSGMQYGQQPTVKAFRGEEEFTSAIQSLVVSEVPKIYFVTGHGEAAPAVQGNGALAGRSLSILMDKMKKDNMVGEEIKLLGGVIPDDADVIAIVGPTRPYTEVEIAALDAFLDGGGRALVALDPLIEADGTMRQTRLEAFLAARGVMVNDDLVVDPSRKLPFFDLSAVYLTDFADHPVTTGLDGIAVLFTVTRSLFTDSNDARILVETSADGWGETDLGMLLRGEPVVFDAGLDTEGPVAAAVVVEGGGPTGEVDADPADVSGITSRLAVFGDSDFLTDVDIGNAGNEILAMNTLNWLAARDHSMGIPPRDMESMSLHIDQQKMRIIFVVVLIVMPLAAILMGVMVWRRRKH